MNSCGQDKIILATMSVMACISVYAVSNPYAGGDVYFKMNQNNHVCAYINNTKYEKIYSLSIYDLKKSDNIFTYTENGQVYPNKNNCFDLESQYFHLKQDTPYVVKLMTEWPDSTRPYGFLGKFCVSQIDTIQRVVYEEGKPVCIDSDNNGDIFKNEDEPSPLRKFWDRLKAFFKRLFGGDI